MAAKASGGGGGAGDGSSSSSRARLDDWRKFFRGANTDIFGIIENSIMVAASDRPQEFKLRRDRLAELLYTSRLTRCTGCDRVELAIGEADEDIVGGVGGFMNDEFDGGDGAFFDVGTGSKESKANSNRDVDHNELNVNQQASNYSYVDAEALTDEIEEQGEMLGEVLRIKEILLNSEDQSDSVIYDSLRRLELMSLTIDILKATEIGKAVNALRRRNSKQIRTLARHLVDDWKSMVTEWVKATSELAAEGSTPDSVNPSSIDDEEGLPSPPLDDFAFCTQNIELSEIFDGMDEDGNPQNLEEFNQKQNGGRRPPVVKPQNDASKRKEEAPPRPRENLVSLNDNKAQQVKKQEAAPRPVAKLSNSESGSGRPVKPNVERNVNNDAKAQQKLTKPTIQRRPAPPTEQKLRPPSEEDVQMKLEASKRRLQERYQEAENAKKQRTIQVMELHDLPKQGPGHKNGSGRSGNFNRNWAKGRK